MLVVDSWSYGRVTIESLHASVVLVFFVMLLSFWVLLVLHKGSGMKASAPLASMCMCMCMWALIKLWLAGFQRSRCLSVLLRPTLIISHFFRVIMTWDLWLLHLPYNKKKQIYIYIYICTHIYLWLCKYTYIYTHRLHGLFNNFEQYYLQVSCRDLSCQNCVRHHRILHSTISHSYCGKLESIGGRTWSRALGSGK